MGRGALAGTGLRWAVRGGTVVGYRDRAVVCWQGRGRSAPSGWGRGRQIADSPMEWRVSAVGGHFLETLTGRSGTGRSGRIVDSLMDHRYNVVPWANPRIAQGTRGAERLKGERTRAKFAMCDERLHAEMDR